MGAVNGHNLGVAVSAGYFSLSATSNDLILRSMNNLLLQSGTGASAITISTANNVGINTATNINTNLYVYGTTGISHSGPIINLATVDSNNYGTSSYYNAFAGDTNIYSYWGVSINLNNGGNNPANAGYTRIPYTSSFTINQKANGGTASSGFTNLFTVLQSGNVGIGTLTPSYALEVYSTTGLRINNTGKLSINGTGNLEVDAPGVGSGRFIVNSSGNVGIGSSAPANKLDVAGNVSCTGNITNGSGSYIYAGGLRIGGFDGNTIYQSGNIGITADWPSTISFNMWGGSGTIMSIYNSGVMINYPTTINSHVNTTGYISAGSSVSSGGDIYTTNNGSFQITYSGTGYWRMYVGSSPNTNKALSYIFNHYDTGNPVYNSWWWFAGDQNGTKYEISDSRSKRNIEDIDSSNISTIINKLKPKKFDVLIDKDVLSQYGFIAQDIEQIPETSNLVYTTTDYIANINSYGTHSNYYITSNIDNSNIIIDNRSVITCSDDITNLISINDEIKFVAENTSNQEFIVDATPYINRYKRRYGKVVNIISSNCVARYVDPRP